MPFDPELDVELAKKEALFEERKTKLVVSIKQYNEGEKKMQLGRENMRGEDWAFAKLGRLTKEEAEAMIPLMKELVDLL